MEDSGKNKSSKKALRVKGRPTKAGGYAKATQYVGHLLELHKVQGTLLNRLNRQLRSKSNTRQ